MGRAKTQKLGRADLLRLPQWWLGTAEGHAMADRKCGREWRCACGACKAARGAGWKPTGTNGMART